MPLRNIDNVTPNRVIGHWYCAESESFLLSALELLHYDMESLSIIKPPALRLEWLCTRMLIKEMLSHFGDENDIIYKDEFGKPCFCQLEYELSISHSFPHIVVIIDKAEPVGVDLEKVRPKLDRIKHKFLSEMEAEYAADNLQKLAVLWSAKEALYKIYGKKRLTFKTELLIEPFNLQSSGTINGTICTDNYKKTVKLKYIFKDDFVTVYNI